MTDDDATRTVMNHRLLHRYVVPGERVVLATRRHWAKLAAPALTSLATLIVCGWLTFVLEPTFGKNAYIALWPWFATFVRFAWLALLWRVEWFVATNKRMLLLSGLITHQVAMMPLMKVTDMRYSRSLTGQMLGYGQFLLESAGQDQALRQINWVSRPEATYRELCALIFTPNDTPSPKDEGDEDDVETTNTSDNPHSRHNPVVIVPGRSHDWVPGREDHGAADTQPLRITPRAEVEVPSDADRASLPHPAPKDPRQEVEPWERAWEVSEPTSQFVDLREERDHG